MRHAARTDANQADIMQALKRVGVAVRYIKQPFDLVAYNPRTRETIFVECKTETGRLTAAQIEWIEVWPGKIVIARSPEDAVRAVLGEEVLA